MSIKAKLAAAVQRANDTGSGNKKKGPVKTTMQPMQVKKPTVITQNRPTGLAGTNRVTAPAPAATSSVKTKSDYKAQNAAAKLESKYAKKSENRSYRQEKSAAKKEMKLDRIKTKESGQLGKKITEGVAAGGAILGLIDQVKKTFPGKKTENGQTGNNQTGG